MKFYLANNEGKKKRISKSEALEHLSDFQMSEGIEAKKADPNEEVSYMTVGGHIIIDL